MRTLLKRDLTTTPAGIVDHTEGVVIIVLVKTVHVQLVGQVLHDRRKVWVQQREHVDGTVSEEGVRRLPNIVASVLLWS